MRPVTRIQPVGPPAAYKTYQVAYPEETHFRDASCSEVECHMQANGWVTPIDETTDLGQRQAQYIRSLSGRHFTESSDGGSGQTLFSFPPGEECFRQHRVNLHREGIHVVRGGDWRGNPTGELRVHDNPAAWQEDFSEHQDRIERALNG